MSALDEEKCSTLPGGCKSHIRHGWPSAQHSRGLRLAFWAALGRPDDSQCLLIWIIPQVWNLPPLTSPESSIVLGFNLVSSASPWVLENASSTSKVILVRIIPGALVRCYRAWWPRGAGCSAGMAIPSASSGVAAPVPPIGDMRDSSHDALIRAHHGCICQKVMVGTPKLPLKPHNEP